MLNLISSLGHLVLGFAAILTPLIAAVLVQGYRGRREALLQLLVLKELNTQELRGLYTVRLKSSLFAGDRVVVDLWGCSREQIWDVIARLSARLPARVQLVLNGISEPESRSSLTLKIERRAPICAAACMP